MEKRVYVAGKGTGGHHITAAKKFTPVLTPTINRAKYPSNTRITGKGGHTVSSNIHNV